MLFSNMMTLAEKTTVWPHPEELFMSGNKIQGYETLRVASLSMKLSVPLYVVVDDQVGSKAFQENIRKGLLQGVLKRDYSMRCEHVITPKTEDALARLKHALREEKKNWPMVQEFFGKPRWFLQPFLTQLLEIGEARVFIVGGRIAYKMCTTQKPGVKDEWACTDEPVLRPLHKHR
jgi:glutathione synthase/RimK-type ligase-like ATP-grasp enzyme